MMKKQRNLKKQSVVSRRPVCLVTVLLMVLLLGFSYLLPADNEEDPIKVIQRNGTAGMKLKGDKKVIVQNDALFIESGKQLNPLFPSTPRFIIKSNASQLGQSDIERLALSAVQAKLGNLYNRSYKVQCSFELKQTVGNEKTILCKLVFEYKNIWFAEEKEMEMVVAQENGALKLKDTRLPMQIAAIAEPKRENLTRRPLMKRDLAAIRQTKIVSTAQVDNGAEKRKMLTLDETKIQEVSKMYASYNVLPVYELALKYRIPAYFLAPTAKGLANTAYPEVVTAEDATDQVHIIMSLALGSAAKLIGPADSSKTKLMSYLRDDSNLVAWNNIGHGCPSTIFQNGTQINASDLPASTTFKGLKGCVCLVNSCQTFNDPLKAAIIGQAPRVYIAGIINLPMVTSECSNPNFWYKTLIQKKPMSVAYTETNSASGLTGYWGYWGYGGTF